MVGRPLSSADEIAVIELGAPVALARQLQQELGVTQIDLARALGIPPRTFASRLRQATFGPDESDRVLRLKRVFEQAVDTFDGDQHAAVAWLRATNRALGGHAPLDLLPTGSGARAVEQVLGRMEHGLYS